MPSDMNKTLLKVPFILLAMICVLLATATLIDREAGLETACMTIYYSPWMTLLWTLTAVSGVIVILGSRVKMRLPGLIFHIALILILLGAAVTHFFSESGKLTIEKNAKAVTSFLSDDGKILPLPFSVKLSSIGVEYHPGTNIAADYYSTLIVNGDSTNLVTVSMNRFATIDGYRLCQNALTDKSTTFTVNHDPAGIGITYSAYLLLFLSMVLLLLDSRGRFISLARRSATVLLLLFATTSLHAANNTAQPRVLQRQLAASFGKLYINDGTRIQPFSTFARNFCLKVYGEPGYMDFTPEQVVTGWMFYYDDWKSVPFIKIKSDIARISLSTTDKHVALVNFNSPTGYILEAPLRDNPTNSALARDNERVAVVTRLVTGASLALQPRRGENGTEWIALNRHSSPYLQEITACIALGHFRRANELIMSYRDYQTEAAGADNLPSQFRLDSERFYFHSCYPLPAAIIILIAGCIFLFCKKHRIQLAIRAVTIAALFYLLYLSALRWIIGGHLPLTNGYETMVAMSIISLIGVQFLWQRYPAVVGPGIITAGASLFVAAMGINDPAIGLLVPVLSSTLLSIHVMLVMTAYSLLAMITGISIVALIKPRLLPERTNLSMMLLYPAELLLGAGIFVGAIWANESWGRYWGWDPKETWALITFIIYAIPFHGSIFPRLQKPRLLSLYLSISFATVLMTYLGVNFLLPGLHSYGTA